MSTIVKMLLGKRCIKNLKCTGCAEVNCYGCSCRCHELMKNAKRIDKDDE